MLTLDVLDSIQLSRKPWGQIAVAAGVLMPNYSLPWTKTEIRLEGEENLPKKGPVIFAMNHTDRFNYWPFQYKLWRDHRLYTSTWVKGKYYNKPAARLFMIKTNNLAVPSRGYLITADAATLLGRPPSEKAYRLIRDTINAQDTDTRKLREKAAEIGVLREIVTLLDTPRDMLGLQFEPHRQNYLEAMLELFERMMEKFVALNEQAFEMGLHVIVFPEGTRSVRLQDGKPGLAQMALRMKATVIPVGSNNSDRAYPGNNPFSRGGKLIYRIGEPLTPEGALAPFQIDEPYVPFTHDAEERFGERFEAMTERVMDRIHELLDPRHQRVEGSTGSVKGADRFL